MRSFPPVDRHVSSRSGGPPELALSFVRESMRQGPAGCIQDYRIFGDPWGFALEEIHLPVQIWEGCRRPDPTANRLPPVPPCPHRRVDGHRRPRRGASVPSASSGRGDLRRSARRGPKRRGVHGAVERRMVGVQLIERSVSTEIPVRTAKVSMPSTSPPIGPMEVAPTNSPSQVTSFTNPSPRWIQPRAARTDRLGQDRDMAPACTRALGFGEPDRFDLRWSVKVTLGRAR